MRDKIIFIGVAVAAVVIGVLVFLYGNIGNGSPLDATSSRAEYTQPSAVPVPFTKIVQGTKSKVAVRANYLITSPSELGELWKMLDTSGAPPKVDFNKNAVIAVFAGEQPTASYAITVSKIVDSDARMVSITIAKPDGNCMTGQALTAPYEIVVVPATGLPLAHEDLSATVSCN